MSGELRTPAGPDVDENGNFLNKEKEKGTLLPFHPYEEGWMRNMKNEALYNQINEEYEKDPTDLKFLSSICDTTVYGSLERLFLESLAGEDFYKPRPLDEEPIDIINVYEKSKNPGVKDYSANLDGYHRRGFGAEGGQSLRELCQKLNITKGMGVKDEETALSMVGRDPAFSGNFNRDDVESIMQFATTLVIFVKDDAWEKMNLHRGDDIKAMAYCSPYSAFVYAPENIKNEPTVLEYTLKHEYQHSIDLNIVKDSPDLKAPTQTKDDILKSLKTEISAYLNLDVKAESNPYNLLSVPVIQEKLREYKKLYSDPENAKKCDRMYELILQTKPFIKGLIKEAGLPEDDNKLQYTFLKTFISALPERQIAFKILERIPETGVYQEGLKKEKKEVAL
ncbi:MAG: hypothetical protein WCJ81_09415 [bacterium]